MNIKALQCEVTNEIIRSLEQGVKPWDCPYVLPTAQMSLPYNVYTGKSYTGINTLILWMQMIRKRHTTNGWLTFKQANAMKGHVIKGEKSTRCFYYNAMEVTDEDSKEVKLVPCAKCFFIFNLDQVSGGSFALPSIPKFDIHEKAEQLVKATGAVLEEGRKAYYRPSEDLIILPSKGVFNCAEDYYGTLFHELIHWTSHETRLNRTLKAKKFGDEAYAFEELVAELGSAFLCAELGLVSNYQNHASYIDSWLKILKADSTAIFKAASLAAKAHKYIAPNSIDEELSANPNAVGQDGYANETSVCLSYVNVA